MGEKVEDKKEGEKAADGGGKKEMGPITVVLKVDLHCEGCAKKVRRAVTHFDGVEKVKTDCGTSKLTVVGNVDPAVIRERVAAKTKKKVDLISPQPKKDAGVAVGGDKKVEEKPADKKPEDKKDKPKEAVVTTISLKMKLHCEGCARKIKRIVLKNIDGVNSVTTNLEKDLVTVTGTMVPKEVVSYLQERLKRAPEILPPPKKEEAGGDKKEKDGGGEKKEKEGGGDKKEKDGEKKEKEKVKEGGDEKKEKDGGAEKVEKKEGGGEVKKETPAAGGSEVKKNEEAKKMEINKMEFQGYNPQTLYAMQSMQPMYNQSYFSQDYGISTFHNQGYGNTSYMAEYSPRPPPPPPGYINDEMFSDENPNGCSVM